MKSGGNQSMKLPPERGIGIILGHAGRIVLAYIAVGGVWILYSDLLVSSLAPNEDILSRIQTYKGLIFIATTALLLWILIRRAEESLARENRARRQSEQQYRDFLAHNVAGTWRFEFSKPMPVGLPLDEQIEWMLDNGVLVECNQAAAKMYGLGSADDVLGKTYREIYAHDEQAAKENLRIWIEGGYRFNRHESLGHLHTGEDRWFLIMAHGVIEDDHLVRSWGTQVDITDRKKAQHALQESKERYQRLVEGIQDEYFIYSHNPEGVFTYLSPSLANVLGYAPEEYFTHYGEAFTDNPINKAADLHTKASLRGELQPSFEVEVHHRDGGARHLEIQEQPVLDKQGRVIAVEGIAHDITNRKLAQVALQERERNYREIFNATSEAILIHEAETGLILDVNQTMLNMYGYTHEEALALQVDDLSVGEPPYDQVHAVQWIRKAVEQGPQLFAWRSKKKSGETFWTEVALSSTEIGGKGRVLAVVRDITERKRAEDALRDSETKLHAIFDHHYQLTGLLDGQGRLLAANKTALEYAGVDAAEVIDRYFWDSPWWDASQESQLRGAVARAAAGEFVRFETTHPTKDGKVRYIDFSLSPVKDDNGNVIYIVPEGRDVTDIKQSEEALRKSEAQHRSLFESANDPILLLDGDRIIDCNPKTCEVLGCSREQIVGHPPERFSPAQQPDERDSREKAREVIENAFQGQPQFFEWRHIKYDGTPFDVEISLNRLELFGHVYVQAIWRDITERKRIEKELHTTQMYYTDFINASSDAVSYWKVPDGLKTSLPVQEQIDRMYQSICVGANRVCWESYGFKHKDEMIGKRYIELIGERTFDQTAADFINSNYRLNNCLVHEKSLQGVEYYGLANWYGVVENGHLISTWISAKDITERKQAEEETTRLRNYLKNIVDSMPSVLIGLDAEGRVTEWNKRAEETTGIGKDQALEKMLPEVMPGLTSKMDKITQALKSYQIQREEKVAQRIHGQTQYADITVYPLKANCVQGAVVRIDDVTDRVRLEEMMVQSEKMATVGGLAAGMAHEINNPLGVIIQGIQTIERRLSPELQANQDAADRHQISLEGMRAYLDDREVLGMAKMVKEAGLRAGGIIKNILQFSRRSDANKARVRLDQLIDRTIELATNDYDLKKRYDFRDIHLECKYDPRLTEIVCVRTEIEQVLLNLLKNAAQAISECKDLTEPRIEVRTWRKGDRALIEVEDNGPGMSEDVRRRVFEPFFTTKEVGIGTGLGLSVSYMIITDKHQGSLTVDSSPGRGTRFTVGLPIEDKEASTPS